MAVAFRSAGARVSNGGTTVNIPFPAGLAAGDLLLIEVFTAGGGSILTTPSGWTLSVGKITFTGPSGAYGYVLTKIATGSESGTQAVVFNASFLGGIMSAFSGVDTTTPVDVSASATLATSGTSAVAPSVTTTKANTLLLHLYWVGAGSAVSVTPAGGDTEIYDSWDANFSLDIEAATIAQAATGSSGTSTATSSAAMNGGGAATVAIAPGSTATTWNGSSTVSLTDTVTTAGTVVTHATSHGASTVAETVAITTAGATRLGLVPRSPGSLILVPRGVLPPLTLTPR